MTRRSGRICTPSTAALGVASFLEWLGGIPVSRSVLPESGSGLPTHATSGRASAESSLSVDQLGASSRTWADTFGLDTSTLYGPTSSALATASRKASSRRRKSARATDGSDCSSWPTATMSDGERSSETMMRGNPTLLGAASRWPTARAKEDGEYQYENGDPAKPRATLTGAARHWPTPDGSVSEGYNQSPSPGAAIR